MKYVQEEGVSLRDKCTGYRMEFSHLFLVIGSALGSCPLQVTVFLQVTPISLLTHQATQRSFFGLRTSLSGVNVSLSPQQR